MGMRVWLSNISIGLTPEIAQNFR